MKQCFLPSLTDTKNAGQRPPSISHRLVEPVQHSPLPPRTARVVLVEKSVTQSHPSPVTEKKIQAPFRGPNALRDLALASPSLSTGPGGHLLGLQAPARLRTSACHLFSPGLLEAFIRHESPQRQVPRPPHLKASPPQALPSHHHVSLFCFLCGSLAIWNLPGQLLVCCLRSWSWNISSPKAPSTWTRSGDNHAHCSTLRGYSQSF